MTTVGIKDLKTHLSKYVARAAAGESVVVTERGLPVAVIGPLPPALQVMDRMRRESHIQWAGGKPKGVPSGKRESDRTIDPDVSGAVIEGRHR